MMINHEVIRYILLLLNCDFFHIKQCIPLHVNVLTFTDFICMELYESRAQLLRGTIRMPSYNNIDVMMAAVAVQARGKPGLYHSMMMPWHRKAFYPNGTLLPVDSSHGVNFVEFSYSQFCLQEEVYIWCVLKRRNAHTHQDWVDIVTAYGTS